MRLALFACLLPRTAEAWVTPPSAPCRHVSTALYMNFFDNLFKVPTYKQKETNHEKEEPVAKQDEKEKGLGVQELGTEKEVSAFQEEEKEVSREEATTIQHEVQEVVQQKEEVPVEKEIAPGVAVEEETPKQAEATVADTDATKLHHGTVEWFSVMKGYGFIRPNQEGEENVFVHHTGIHMDGFRKLRQGQPVSYLVHVDDSTGKSKAVEVTNIAQD